MGANGINLGEVCHCEERERRSNPRQNTDCFAALAMTLWLNFLPLPLGERMAGAKGSSS
jgi:hypothetical protein